MNIILSINVFHSAVISKLSFVGVIIAEDWFHQDQSDIAIPQLTQMDWTVLSFSLSKTTEAISLRMSRSPEHHQGCAG